MIELQKDLWSIKADARVITTNGTVKSNGSAVMGRGCAREAAEKWPWLPESLGRIILLKGNRVHVFHAITPSLVTFPVKHEWMQDADIRLIEQSANQLVGKAEKYGWEKIVLPRPGCGNGNLQWKTVKPVIEPYLDDRFVVVSFRGEK